MKTYKFSTSEKMLRLIAAEAKRQGFKSISAYLETLARADLEKRSMGKGVFIPDDWVGE